MFTKEDVLEIVDVCFHAYASSYRTDAKELAIEVIDRRLAKYLYGKDTNMKTCATCGTKHLIGTMCPKCYGK